MKSRCVWSLIAVAALLLPACSQAATQRAGATWETFALQGNEVERYASIGEVSRAASLVIRGRVGEIGGTRSAESDPETHFVTVLITPTWSSTPKPSPAVVAVEFVATNGAENFDTWYDRMKASPPTGDAIYFLRLKNDGQANAGAYRLVNSAGLVVERDGRIVFPLSDPSDPAPYVDDTRSMTSLDDLQQAVSASAAAT